MVMYTVAMNTDPDQFEWSVEPLYFDAKYVFDLAGEDVAGSAGGEATYQWVCQVDSDKSESKESHQYLQS